MTDVIDSFTGDYSFLSNFYRHPVRYDGVVYSTNEHAFQAAKTLDMTARARIFDATTPQIAKRIGRGVQLRPHWDEAWRYRVMWKLVHEKFNDLPLSGKLKATGDAVLIEGNTWGDRTWGISNGTGHNLLGWMLMMARQDIL